MDYNENTDEVSDETPTEVTPEAPQVTGDDTPTTDEPQAAEPVQDQSADVQEVSSDDVASVTTLSSVEDTDNQLNETADTEPKQMSSAEDTEQQLNG